VSRHSLSSKNKRRSCKKPAKVCDGQRQAKQNPAKGHKKTGNKGAEKPGKGARKDGHGAA